MKTLVTGATGRIGYYLIDELLKRDYGVRALVMPEDPLRHRLEKPGVECVEGSLNDVDSLLSAVNGVDAVFHLAAVLPRKRTVDGLFEVCSADELFEVNIRGTFNLLEAIQPNARSIRRFVMASSDSVYRDARGARYLPLDENYPRLADNPYGLSKVVCEDMCWSYMRQCGLPVTIARIGLTLECHELVDPFGIVANRFFLKAILDSRKANCDPTREEQELIRTLKIHDTADVKLVIPYDFRGNVAIDGANDVRNVAEALPLLLEKQSAVGETFNLAAATSFAYDEAIRYMSGVTGFPYVDVIFPSLASRWIIDIGKARAILGYNPKRDVFQMISEGWLYTKDRCGNHRFCSNPGQSEESAPSLTKGL